MIHLGSAVEYIYGRPFWTSISIRSLPPHTNAPIVPIALPKVPIYASMFDILILKDEHEFSIEQFFSVHFAIPKPCASSINKIEPYLFFNS